MKNKLFNQYKNNKDVRILTANFASLAFLQVFGKFYFPHPRDFGHYGSNQTSFYKKFQKYWLSF